MKITIIIICSIIMITLIVIPVNAQENVGSWIFNSISGVLEYWFGGNIISTSSNTLVKQYDTINKIITIKNTTDNFVLMDIQLLTPLSLDVIRGEQRKVAVFTLSKNKDKDMGKVLNQIDLYYKDNKNSGINRNINYKYLTTYNEKVKDYIYLCDNKTIIYLNGSKGIETINCINKEIGSHDEIRELWNNFTDDSKLSNNVTIGIFADVYPDDNVEWVQDFAGIKVNEWASWNDTLTNGLVIYYNFNNSNNDVSNTKYNLTIGNGTGMANVSSGCKIGMCGRFNLTDYSNITAFLNSSKNFTMNYWIYGGNKENQYIRADGQFYSYWHETSGIQGQYYANWGGDVVDSNLPDIPGRWEMITFIKNDTGYYVYQNATLGASDTSPVTYAYKISPMKFFSNSSTSNFYIDEFSFHNRSLNQDELNQLYNLYNGITYQIGSSNSCTAPISGDWLINCADNCIFTTTQIVPANIITYGSGILTINSQFQFSGSNQYVTVQSGCRIDRNSGGYFP